jgi:hypothetical protein
MADLLSMWPSRAQSREQVAVLFGLYRPALADLTDDELAEAVRTALRDCRFFPVPAELRAFARPPAPARDFELDYDPLRGHRERMLDLLALPAGPVVSQEELDARARATLERMHDFDRGRRERLAAQEANRNRRRRGYALPAEVLAELAAVRERMRETTDTAAPAGG